MNKTEFESARTKLNVAFLVVIGLFVAAGMSEGLSLLTPALLGSTVFAVAATFLDSAPASLAPKVTASQVARAAPVVRAGRTKQFDEASGMWIYSGFENQEDVTEPLL